MKRFSPLALAALVLVGGVLLVYLRVFSAGFVGFDDDLHVYANPFLNPPTLQSVGKLWQHCYEQLYVPLAYTLFAALARIAQVPVHVDDSLGRSVSLDPAVFHVAGVALHVVNALLCWLLMRRFTRRSSAAVLGALVFALHPLQLESVAWISELRGLASGFFALLALYALGLARQTPARARALLAASALLVSCAMLCKPSAAALPLVALALDRLALGTSWRKAVVLTSLWAACAAPWVWLTRSVQTIPAAGESVWWQRPFIAGDALAFYLFKTFVPLDLCVDYGRTPHAVMAHAWAYLAWLVPLGLLVLAYRKRARWPLTWLGALLFASFLLPTSGLLPFAFQAYSTVADRYAYLALLGLGLAVAEATDTVAAQGPRKWVVGVLSLAVLGLAARSFDQSRHWLTSAALLQHTIAVNPDAGFAYNNLGDIEQARGDYPAALAHYRAGVEHDPGLIKAYVNLAEVYAALERPAEAEHALAQAARAPGLTLERLTADDLTNLGIVQMKLRQYDRALWALSKAVSIDPSAPLYLFNQANALAGLGQFPAAEAAFRRCLTLAPTLTGAHVGLGIVLAETQRLAAAVDEFRSAVRLQPDDPAALENLARAERMLAAQPR